MTTALPADPWKALGVDRDADKGEIRAAYKKLVLQCHPDKVQDPTLKALKQNDMPLADSPPRVSRSNTAPHSYDRHIPSLARTQTYLAASAVDGQRPPAEFFDDYASEDERERHRRRSRRGTRSPAPEPVRYKVDGVKTSKLDAPYAYGESPTSRRRHDFEAHSPSTYAGVPFKVKESRNYGPSEIIYTAYDQPAYYSGDGYNPVVA
ncbi:hypothetical protein BT67DRAFT_368955 [Trichocladium antarcticum]|uniref:J domain-containing protein n=1 Tax=Trichocladium antarcticum TaxID=1450529 RepID=A0AAN6ZHX4_9PEZI|nr:hypothetical protein BT67DRAFT_368955 [Trichocladium antarcticum]